LLIKIPELEYKEIIIGGNLNALLQSYQNQTPLIINKLLPPHRFDMIGIYNARELWHRLFFSLSMSGLNLLTDKANNTRIKENKISVSTINARVLKIKFEKLLVFDNENVSGLPLPIKENKDFVVLDWMSARSCEKHAHDYLNTKDDFINEVHFYPTERLDGHHPDNKDLVTISYLSEEQLNDFEYSDTYARFKITKMLKDLGIKGKKNSPNHYTLKLEVEKREIMKAKMSLYGDLENIKFKYKLPEKINKLCKGIM